MKYIRVIDLETTGFKPPEAAPCEIGFCDVLSRKDDLAQKPTSWNVVGGFGTLCHPGMPIPAETSAIHHLIDKDVADKLPWTTVFEELFANSFDNCGHLIAYAAHHAKFEKQWVTEQFTGQIPWICTYKCALRLWPDAPSHSNQALRYWINPPGLNRDIANVAHRAYPDAYVTAFLLCDMLEFATIEQLIAWSAEPALLPRVTFGAQRGKAWKDVEDGFLKWVLARDFDENVIHTAQTELKRRANPLPMPNHAHIASGN